MSDTATHYFFCGIGGIGMSALAQLLVQRGETVSGSNDEASPVTEMLKKQGIAVTIGQKSENVPEMCEYLIYTDATSADNPERVAARERGIPELSYFAMLGRVSAGYRTLAVAGTHGKTTTTGMLAAILRDAGASPSAIVGSIVQDFGSNYVQGDSDLLIVEACEYRDHLLELSPEVLVVNNLEWDHTDYFDDLASLQATFRKSIERVPAHGVIVTDPSSPTITPLLEGIAARVVDYTQEPAYELLLPGEFNQNNARAASAAARALVETLTTERIATTLAKYHGTWRRFELKGTLANNTSDNTVTVYDDYAHHPTAVAETLRALRAKCEAEGKQHADGTAGRVIVAFHPHLYSRTRDLLDGFARAFVDADLVVVAPIYAAREVDDGSVSSELLAQKIREHGGDATACDSLTAVETWLRDTAQPSDTIMTMGAGDIYKVADALVGKDTGAK